MKLTHLRFSRLGPFYFNHEIEIDPRVTILTGSNDTGKSCSLRFVKLLLENKNIEEMDVNQDYLQESQVKWKDDQSLKVELQFLIEAASETGGIWTQHYGVGDFGVVSKAMAVGSSPWQFKVLSKKHGERGGWEFGLPSVVMLSGTDGIRETMDLSALNPLEASLLKIGFGATFNFQRLNALGAINYSRQLDDAEYRLNKHMERSMPIPSSLKFKFLPIEGNRKMLAVLLRDKRKRVEQQKVAETHLDVPIILLKDREEFEQLVPVELYFEALAEELGQTGRGKELFEQWQIWIKTDEKYSRMVFSKQVWHWVDATFDDFSTSKPAVMRKAVELAEPKVINAEPLRNLLTAIRDHLSNTSF